MEKLREYDQAKIRFNKGEISLEELVIAYNHTICKK